jgi:hypothetical protein
MRDDPVERKSPISKYRDSVFILLASIYNVRYGLDDCKSYLYTKFCDDILVCSYILALNEIPAYLEELFCI